MCFQILCVDNKLTTPDGRNLMRTQLTTDSISHQAFHDGEVVFPLGGASTWKKPQFSTSCDHHHGSSPQGSLHSCSVRRCRHQLTFEKFHCYCKKTIEMYKSYCKYKYTNTKARSWLIHKVVESIIWQASTFSAPKCKKNNNAVKGSQVGCVLDFHLGSPGSTTLQGNLPKKIKNQSVCLIWPRGAGRTVKIFKKVRV